MKSYIVYQTELNAELKALEVESRDTLKQISAKLFEATGIQGLKWFEAESLTPEDAIKEAQEYGFKYEAPKSTPKNKTLSRAINRSVRYAAWPRHISESAQQRLFDESALSGNNQEI